MSQNFDIVDMQRSNVLQTLTQNVEQDDAFAPTPEQAERYRKEIQDATPLKRLLGNYAILFMAISGILMIVAVVLLVTLIDHVPLGVYFAYGFGACLIVICATAVGFTVHHSSATVTQLRLARFKLGHLFVWTRRKLAETKNLNERRFLIENVVGCWYEFKEFASGHKGLQNLANELRDLLSGNANADAIRLSCMLFKTQFQEQRGRFSEKGTLLVMKYFEPVVYFVDNQNLAGVLASINAQFSKGTKIYFDKSRTMTLTLDPSEKVVLRKTDAYSDHTCFNLFENLWFVNADHVVEAVDVKEAQITDLVDHPTSGRSKPVMSFTPMGQGERFFNRSINGFRSESMRSIIYHSSRANIGSNAYTNAERKPISAFMKDDPANMSNLPGVSMVNLDTNEFDPGVELPYESPDDPQAPNQTRTPRASMRASMKSYMNIDAQSKLSIIRDDKTERVDIVYPCERPSLITMQRIHVGEEPKPKVDQMDETTARLLEIEQESEESYKLILKNDKMVILRKNEEGSPVVLIKSIATVEGNADQIFKLIYDLNYRGKWDRVFTNLRIVKNLDSNTDVMYSYLKAPFCVTDRDFLQTRTCHRNFHGLDYVIAFRSYDDPTIPPLKNVIRAQTIISGYIIRRLTPTTSKLTIVSQTDIKGFIPKAVINAAASKSPLDWIKRLESGLALLKD